MKQIGYVLSTFWSERIRVCVDVTSNMNLLDSDDPARIGTEKTAKRQAAAIANKPAGLNNGRGCNVSFSAIVMPGAARVEWETLPFVPRKEKSTAAV